MCGTCEEEDKRNLVQRHQGLFVYNFAGRPFGIEDIKMRRIFPGDRIPVARRVLYSNTVSCNYLHFSTFSIYLRKRDPTARPPRGKNKMSPQTTGPRAVNTQKYHAKFCAQTKTDKLRPPMYPCITYMFQFSKSLAPPRPYMIKKIGRIQLMLAFFGASKIPTRRDIACGISSAGAFFTHENFFLLAQTRGERMQCGAACWVGGSANGASACNGGAGGGGRWIRRHDERMQWWIGWWGGWIRRRAHAVVGRVVGWVDPQTSACSCGAGGGVGGSADERMQLCGG